MSDPDRMALAIAEVLNDHEIIGKAIPAGDGHECRYVATRDGCGCARIVVGCTAGCDWQAEADGMRGDAHRLHVADVIMKLLEESEGCDCTELCAMGPTCPGGMLAGLPDAGCWRTADAEDSAQ